MSETKVTYTARFEPSRPRRARRPAETPTVPTEPRHAASGRGPSRPRKINTGQPSRAARLLGLAYLIERRLGEGKLKSYAEAARALGISRARMAQVTALLNLAPRVQETLLDGRLHVGRAQLRAALG